MPGGGGGGGGGGAGMSADSRRCRAGCDLGILVVRCWEVLGSKKGVPDAGFR